MKKRILSMLLLVAMVVTALPLMALTVLATGTQAEEPTFTEDEYNDLYVEDGLFFAADFFETKANAASLSDYIWKKTGSPTLSATNGTVADGKLSIAAGALTIKPAGNMGATDYDFSVEYVMDAQSFSAGNQSIGIRNTYLYNATITAPQNGNGMVFSFKNMRWNGTNYSTWSYANGWTQGTWNAFTRHLLSFNALTVALKAGADTMSFVFAMRDFVDLTVDRAKELEAEVEAGRHAPVFAVYVPGKTAATYASPTAVLYRDESCVIGYRISRETFEESKKTIPQQYWKWVDADFEPYTDITKAKLEALTAENCTYKLYATQAEAQNAMKNAPATDGTETVKYTYTAVGSGSSWQVERTATSVTDATVTTETLPTVYATEKAAKDAFAKMVPTDATANYVYSVGGVYSQLMDETPAGIDPKLVVGAGSSWSDYIGHTKATFTGDVYAIRYYSRALTEGETLENHTVDLAKFFGLNIAAYRLLDGEGRAAVAEDMATYQLTSDAAAVGEAFEAACFRELEEQYTGSYDYDSYATFLKYGLDPTPALALPRDVAKRINALLEQLLADGTYAGDYATLQAAYKAAVAADAEAYAELVDHDEAYYNELYVKDGLFFAADFYKTNEHWLNVTEETAASLTTESNYAPYVWFTTGTKGILTSDAAGKAFGGKLSLSSTRMVIRHGGSLTATDYNTTVEHVISPRSFTSKTKPFTVRGMVFNAWSHSVVDATETTGLSYPISGLYSDKNGDASWGTNGDNPHYGNLGFSRTVFSFGDVPVTYTFRPGTSTVSYVMNFEDFVDLTLEEKDALKAAVVSGAHAAPMTIYSVGGDKMSFNIGDSGFYNNIDECTLGYRVMKQVGSKYYWADENFAAMTSLTTAKIDTITSIDNNVAKLYATEAEAKAAIKAYYALGENDDLPTDLSVQKFYGKHLDKDPYGVDSNFFYASNNANSYDYIGYTGQAKFTGDVYAIRYYDRALTEAETLANHAADVLKFYRLNLGILDATDKALMAELGEATKDIMVGVSTRSEAQAALFGVIADEVEAHYARYADLLGEDLEVAKAYQLDAAALASLPVYSRNATKTLLATLTADGTYDNAGGTLRTADEALEAALTADATAYAALANEGTTFYDELYAQDGYVFGLDFFTLGRPDVWGDAAPAIPFKDVDLSGVTIAEGEDGSSTTYSNNAGLKSALEQFKKDHNSFVEQFITERDVAGLNFQHYIATSTSYSRAKAVYLPDVGSIRFHKNASGTNGIQPYSFPSIATDNVSFQLVMAPNEGLTSAFFFFYNIRPSIYADSNGDYAISGLTNGFTKTSHKSYASIPKTSDAQMLTFTLENVVTNKADVTYSVRLWNELLSETKGSCTGADNNTYLGWGGNAAMNLYAFRVYNAELTPEEIKQNHFADVAKYFRLNLTDVNTKDTALMSAIYDAVAGISLTDSTRDEAQLAVLRGLGHHYLAMSEDIPEKSEFIAMALRYGVDTGALRRVLFSDRDMSAFYNTVTEGALAGTGSLAAAQSFFVEQTEKTYEYYSYVKDAVGNEAWRTFLYAAASAELDVSRLMVLPIHERLTAIDGLADGQAALNSAVDAAMAKYVTYAKEKAEKYEADDYNALYVRDGLFFAADFYSTNEHWGGGEIPVNANGSLLGYAWKRSDGTNGTVASSLATTTATTISGGKLLLNTQKLSIVPGGAMTATDYDLTTERVMEYKDASDARALEIRNFFFNTNGKDSYDAETGMTIAISNLAYNSEKTWGSWGTSRSWQSFYAGVHDYGGVNNPTRLVLAPGVQKLTIALAFSGMVNLTEEERDAKLGNVDVPAIAIYNTGGDNVLVDVPNGMNYAKKELLDKWRVIRWKTNGGAENSSATVLGIYDTKAEAETAMTTFKSTQDDAADYTYKVNEHYRMEDDLTPYGVPAAFIRKAGWNDPIYGTADVYAIRYYDRALTEAEAWQNHFADLAKFYRLDIANYLAMTADEKIALHEAMAACRIGDDRDAVVSAYYAGCADLYAGLALTGDAATDAALREFAATVGLDVSRLAKLSANKALAEKVLALADTAYAFDTSVINYRLDDEILDFWEVNESKGVSVRVDNAYSDKQAGVRAEYAIGVDLIKTMIDKYGVDGAITFGTKIMMNGNEAAILSFTATKDNAAENGLAIVGTNTVVKTGAVTAANTKVVGGQLTYTYTVNYTDAQLTQANLLDLEYSFVRFVEIHGEEFVIDHGNKEFGDRVSLREAYSHFAGDYATDSVVTKVMGALAANPKQ